MAPQSRGGTTSTGTPPHVRGLQTYSLSTPNLRTLSSALDSSPVHQRQNGDFVVDDDIAGGGNEDGDTDDADFQRHYSLDGTEDSEEEEEEEGDDGDEDEDPGRPRPYRPSFHRSASDNPLSSPTHQTLQHHNSFPNNPNHHFAPPFYNRPPTPLPPSPSLTSLLRPPFSSSRPASSPSRPTTRPSTSSRPTATPPATSLSRPTTPVSTSDEDTEAAVARAETVPRVSPKVPTYEYYGFVLYLVSSVFFLIYLLWSYLPSPFLHALGIYYYPNRWWSLAIPSFLVMSLIYIYVALAAYNTEYLTLPIESIENIVDEVASVAALHGSGGSGSSGRGRGKVKGKGKGKGKGERWRGGKKEEKASWSELWGKGTDAVLDVPVGGVCEVLYGEGREGGVESGEDTGFTLEQ